MAHPAHPLTTAMYAHYSFEIFLDFDPNNVCLKLLHQSFCALSLKILATPLLLYLRERGVCMTKNGCFGGHSHMISYFCGPFRPSYLSISDIFHDLGPFLLVLQRQNLIFMNLSTYPPKNQISYVDGPL